MTHGHGNALATEADALAASKLVAALVMVDLGIDVSPVRLLEFVQGRWDRLVDPAHTIHFAAINAKLAAEARAKREVARSPDEWECGGESP